MVGQAQGSDIGLKKSMVDACADIDAMRCGAFRYQVTPEQRLLQSGHLVSGKPF